MKLIKLAAWGAFIGLIVGGLLHGIAKLFTIGVQ